MPYTPDQRRALQKRCHVFLNGFAPVPLADEFERAAAWARESQAEHDVYGDGGLVADFERKVAEHLRFEAAAFMPSGVMAQLIALRIHAEAARLPRFGLHPTSHLVGYEENAFAELMRLDAVSLGEAHRPLVEADLSACREPLASVVVELPAREIGGQLPDWASLEAMKAWAAREKVALHMDGARLWECAAWYGRTHAEIAAGFASVYVSLYKGLGGVAGAMLVGGERFVAQARVWRRRMGGTLSKLGPMAATAAMRFDERLALMPALYRRTTTLAPALATLPGLRVVPEVPQVNMLHLHFDAPVERLMDARDRLAEEEGVWLFARARQAGVPGWSAVEIYVGDTLLAHDDAWVAARFERLLALARG